MIASHTGPGLLRAHQLSTAKQATAAALLPEPNVAPHSPPPQIQMTGGATHPRSCMLCL